MSIGVRVRALGTTFLRGIEFADWKTLLADNRFGVSSEYFARAAATTAISLINSAARRAEDRLLGEVRPTAVESPLFVLGHYRSGTTYLHNLLALDSQFAFANVYQVHFPNSFLTTEPRLSRPMSWLFPRGARQADNVEESITSPCEDEWATCNMSCISPNLSFVFPQRADYYDRYVTFRDATPQEIGKWQAALVLFMKKLTWKYRRRLVMKSPSHTGRIRHLLELFPNARFVHIHRHPLAVFRSTRRVDELMFRRGRLQPMAAGDHDDRIIARYQAMFAEFHEQKRSIPPGRFHEMRFDELVQDPIAQMKAVYERLEIPDFERAEPNLRRYAASLGGYENNRFADIAADTKARLLTAWERCFDEWKYSATAFRG